MSPRSGATTRSKLLDEAEALVHQQGFAATSIEMIIGNAGVTKGTFFYHFESKNDLARALIQRFADADGEFLTSNMERAEKLSDDPLQQVIIFVGLIIEVAEQLDHNPQPGCLFATYAFERGLFDEETKTIIANALLRWRQALGEKLHAAAELHPPQKTIEPESLADMLTVLFEGAFVVSRSLQGPGVFTRQLRHYRRYLQLLFTI